MTVTADEVSSAEWVGMVAYAHCKRIVQCIRHVRSHEDRGVHLVGIFHVQNVHNVIIVAVHQSLFQFIKGTHLSGLAAI